jgi:hypothetical protein
LTDIVVRTAMVRTKNRLIAGKYLFTGTDYPKFQSI